MYKQRKKNLIAKMKEHNVEFVIIHSNLNIYYFTGYYSNPRERLTAVIIYSSGEDILIVPSLDRQGAEKSSKVDKIVDYEDHENPFLIIGQTIGENTETLALEEKIWTIAKYKQLSSIYPNALVIDIGSWIDQLREIKSPEEITNFKKAIALTEAGLEYGIKLLHNDLTEQELAMKIEFKLREDGVHKLGFDVKVISGQRSSLPHGKPGSNKIAKNSFVLFDMGMEYNGYKADISRTVVLGEPTEEMTTIYHTVQQALDLSIKAVKPGVKISELDKIARDYIQSKGYGPYFIHRLGHGLGLELHESPYIHGENEDVLKEGMVFTIEPGIYIPHIGGVRIEDDILVTADGYEVLTNVDKNLLTV